MNNNNHLTKSNGNGKVTITVTEQEQELLLLLQKINFWEMEFGAVTVHVQGNKVRRIERNESIRA